MFQGILGLLTLTGIAWLISENRADASWKTVATGLGLQILLALLLLKLPVFKDLFLALNDALLSLSEATRAGTAFVFGYLGGGELPFAERSSGSSFVFAFQALPMVLVVSALSALLFYWRILPLVVRGFGWALSKTLGIGGALGLSTAANIFMSMMESPLLIRPYLLRMSRFELFAVMTAGMATIAGTVMVLYATILSPVIPDAMGHILTASIISAPAAVMVARLMVPDSGPGTAGDVQPPDHYRSSMDAVTRGTLDGLRLLLNIIALLIVLVALVSLINQILGLFSDLSLQKLLGWVMAPVVWLMGIPWAEAQTAGALMGTKTVLNELLAYLQMAELPEENLSPHSRLIMTYALCGFANFGSLGIMLGGLTTMAPERRDEIIGLGMKSILSGTLATCLTGAVVGIIAI
ncbi:MAG: nucleoside transporter C-terminal domain-containing protein [Pseudomonadota bacterium]